MAAPHTDIDHRSAVAARIALIVMPVWSVCALAQAPARNGNESDYRDWQPTRGQVREEERAAGIGQAPAERKSEDRELQDLYKNLLNQEQPASPVQPDHSR